MSGCDATAAVEQQQQQQLEFRSLTVRFQIHSSVEDKTARGGRVNIFISGCKKSGLATGFISLDSRPKFNSWKARIVEWSGVANGPRQSKQLDFKLATPAPE